MADTFILSAARTPMGGFQGELSGLTAPQLGSAAIAAALARAGITGEDVAEVLMGNVLPAGIGQAPARQASLGAGIPDSIPATTISKVCGSGMKAIMIGAAAIAAGHADIVVTGGMESMTNSPYLLPKARSGFRMGHAEVKDHMFLDGLEDAYEHRLMGTYGDEAARAYQLTREMQDAYAVESLSRAKRAVSDGSFAAEIAPVTVRTKAGDVEIAADEQPGKADPKKIPNLKPAFAKDGTVTAATSASISDGAAALVIAGAAAAGKRGAKPIARLVGQASYAGKPGLFTSAPVYAIQRLFQKTGWTAKDVDLFEINEAFANVAMIAMKEHGLPHDIVNVNGGACALGHPIGASGARIVVTLIHALQARGLKRGVASLCIGGGEATAVAVELV
ncbi:MAG: acetyl-CoA C-acyltransferase [Micropepsaceae bacterium]